MFKLAFKVHDHTYLAERIDRLTMLYLDKHYDIKSMSVDEFIENFNKVRREINEAVQAPKSKDLL